MHNKLQSICSQLIEQIPVGIIIVRVNTNAPEKSLLVYYNKHANKELNLDLSKYKNSPMPDMLISKKGLLDKYVDAMESQNYRKMSAKLKDRASESNFSIVLIPVGEDYVAAIYQRIDEKIKAIKLAKALDIKEGELEDKDKTIQELMGELKVISKRIKKNGYRE